MEWDELQRQANGGCDKQFMEDYRDALQHREAAIREEIRKVLDENEDIYERYAADAAHRGRTVEDHALYVLRANQGLCQVDDCDEGILEAARLNQRMRAGRISLG